MKPEEIEKWLKDDERRLYNVALAHQDVDIGLPLESLARCKMLMKKHQYQYFYNKNDGSEGRYCICCGIIEGLPCKPDCEWAKMLDGLGGGGDDAEGN